VTGLARIRELLKPDGVLFIQTPNACRPTRLFRYLVRRKALSDNYAPANVGDLHLCSYDYMALELAMNFVGLKATEIIPTQATLPKLGRLRCCRPLFRFLARRFPFFSDNMLLRCARTEPIDVDAQIRYWDETRNQVGQ